MEQFRRDRQTLANQVAGTLDSVVSLANTSYGGIHLFGAPPPPRFLLPPTLLPSGYQYNGNDGVNSVAIGDGYEVPVNVPHDQLLQHYGADLLGSLQQLVTALQGGDRTAIGTGTHPLRSALDYVTQERTSMATSATRSTRKSILQNETVSLKARKPR